MKDNVLKFDTVVAALALLMSSVTAAAMLYQTHVIEQQFAATVWPYLSIETTYNPNNVSIRLINDGAGPALIRSAQLLVDGRPVGGWGDLVHDIAKQVPHLKHGRLAMQMSSLDASVAIRPGESRSLVSLSADPAVFKVAREHAIGLRFCYCSINERCWKLDGDLNSERVQVPVLVSQCAVGAVITAPI